MKFSNAEALTGLIASIFGGCIFVYKKGIKPVWRSFKRYSDIIIKADKIELVEKRLELVEKRLECLMRMSETPFIEFSTNGNCIAVNQSACTIFGVDDPHKMFGYGWCNFIADLTRQQARAEWREVVKTDSQIEKLFTIVNPHDGKETKVKLFAEISKNSKEEIIIIIGKFKVLT